MTILPLLRGLHVAAMASVLGTAGFLAWMLPAAQDRSAMAPVLIRLWRLSAWIALALGVTWFVAQTVDIAGTTTLTGLAEALPVVALETRYGRIMLPRLALLLPLAVLAGPAPLRVWGALLTSGAALVLQADLGHAGARGGALLIACEWLHLLAAGVWLGALLPLWLTIGRLPSQRAAAVCERFSPVGLACVLLLAGTGLLQGMTLIGGAAALAATAYGRITLLKLALFLLALAFAAANRLWLTDRLSAHAPGARNALRRSVLAETAAGLLVIAAAGFLASASPPARHGAPAGAAWPLDAAGPVAAYPPTPRHGANS